MKNEYWIIGIILAAMCLIFYSQINDSISSHRSFKVNMKQIEVINDSNRRLSELVNEISKGSLNSAETIKAICQQNEEIRQNNDKLTKQNRLLVSTTKELKAVYRLSKGERFSTISVSSDEPEFRTFDFVVMNPPYSVKWTPVKSEENKAFGLAPKSYADFQFVLHGLHHLRDAAKLIAVLPHGVLFRGNGEKTIRENLIRAGFLEYVVGLPDKLFLNTSIPVCLLGLSKQNNSGTLFIDASQSYKKRSKQNEMLDEHVQLVIDVIRCRNSIQGFSKLVSRNELEENDFNLNIPRYVDRLEKEEPVDFANSVRELVQIDNEIKQTEKELLRQITELTGFSYDEAMEINKWERQLLGRSRSAPRSKDQKKDNSTQLELF